jgi:endonuclease-3
MLIATILSQNTNDKNSYAAYARLKKKFPSWERAARAPRRSIMASIKAGGMAHQKSARIRNILLEIERRFGGFSLDSLREMKDEDVIGLLTGFHGVGFKTASCVLLFSLGRDIVPVDTHVHRICTRLGLAPGSRTPEQTFMLLRGCVSAGKGYSFHTNMIRFGRKICRARNPLCGECPLFSLCLFRGKERRARTTPSKADHDFMLLDNVMPGRTSDGVRT